MPLADFRSPRLFVDAGLEAGGSVALDRNQSNYLGNVLRLSAGGSILAFNGRDGEWQAAISGRKRPEQLEIVAALLQHGADPLARDARCRTAIDSATSSDVRLALQRGD